MNAPSRSAGRRGARTSTAGAEAGSSSTAGRPASTRMSSGVKLRIVRRPPRSPPPRGLPGADSAAPGLAETAEDVVRRLLAAGRRDETRLPTGKPALVAEQEPDEHLDAPVLPRDREGLREVLRLLLRRDAEEAVGRIRLVAVFGDPDRLAAEAPRHLADQDV